MREKMALSHSERRPSMVTYAWKFNVESLKDTEALFGKTRKLIDLLLKNSRDISRNAEEGDQLIPNFSVPNADPEIFWTDKKGELKQSFISSGEEGKHYFNIQHIPFAIHALGIDIKTTMQIGSEKVKLALDDLILEKEDIKITDEEVVECPEDNSKHLEAVFYAIRALIQLALDHPEEFPSLTIER